MIAKVTMPNEVYKLPVPSSWIASPEFYERLGRSCELTCEYEKVEVSEITQLSLIFKSCWGVKITYFVATDIETSNNAYDKVIDFGETEWLRTINKNLAISEWETGQLRHLGIFFDDGPLYEFICESFEAHEQRK